MNNIYIGKILLLLLLLVSQFGFAQHKKITRNSVKWNYSLVLRGVYLVNYEFFIADKLNAEIGMGFITEDRIFEVFNSDPQDPYSFIKNSYGKHILHTCAEAGLRYYLKTKDNINGIYLSPMISYRPYSFEGFHNKGSNSNGGFPENFHPGYNLLDFQLKLGLQYQSFWNTNLLTDIYTGLALRSANISEVITVNNNSTFNATYQVSNTNSTYLMLLLGFKIGLPF